MILENCIKYLLSIKNLEKLELRTSFANNESEARQYVKYFLQAYKKYLYENCIKVYSDGKKEIIKKYQKLGLYFILEKVKK